MTRFFLIIYAALMLAFVAGTGQSQDKLENYQLLGRSQTAAYLADIVDSVSEPGGKITFTALTAKIDRVDDAGKKIYLDENNAIFMDVVANCFKLTYTITGEHGMLDGKPFTDTHKGDKEQPAPKDSNIYKIVNTVCTLKNGPRV